MNLKTYSSNLVAKIFATIKANVAMLGGSATQRFKVADAVEDNEALAKGQFNKITPLEISTHDVSSTSDIKELISKMNIGGYLHIKLLNDIELDEDIILYVSLYLDLNGCTLSFANKTTDICYAIRSDIHMNPTCFVTNGKIISPTNDNAYYSAFVGWLSRLRLVLANNLEIELSKGSILNAHSVGSIDVIVKGTTISKGANYETTGVVTNGSYGSFPLRLVTITYQDSLTKSDAFNGTYVSS